MNVRFKYVILVFLFLSVAVSELHASYSLLGLEITVYVQDDGSAYVQETYTIRISGNESIQKYKESIDLLKRNDIQAWRDTLNIPLVYHLGGSPVTISDFTLTPQPIVLPFSYLNETTTSIVLTYVITPPANSTGLFIVTRPAPRLYKYVLNTDAFMFDKTTTGDFILPQNTKMVFVLPDNVVITKINPPPSEPEGIFPPVKGIKKLVWERTTVLSGFALEFEKEEPLEAEISAFLNKLERFIVDLYSGENLLPSSIITVTFLIALVYVHRLRRPKHGE